MDTFLIICGCSLTSKCSLINANHGFIEEHVPAEKHSWEQFASRRGSKQDRSQASVPGASVTAFSIANSKTSTLNGLRSQDIYCYLSSAWLLGVSLLCRPQGQLHPKRAASSPPAPPRPTSTDSMEQHDFTNSLRR